MANELDFTAAWCPWSVDPGDDCAVALTVPAGYESGTWTASIYSDDRAAVASVTVSGVAAGQVITFTLTDAQTTGLIVVGAEKYVGFYRIQRTAGSITRTYVKGTFVLPRGRS